MNGNPKIILALIWTIILNFFLTKFRSLQIRYKQVPVNESINELLNEIPNENKPKDVLNLLIDSLRIKFNLKLNNLKKDFVDGWKILSIINQFKPNLNLIAKGKKFETDYERLKFALNCAEHYLNIKKIINENDISDHNPDLKSLIIYFHQFVEKGFENEIQNDAIYDKNLLNDCDLIKCFIDKVNRSLINNNTLEQFRTEFKGLKPIYEKVNEYLDKTCSNKWISIENKFEKEEFKLKIENILKDKMKSEDEQNKLKIKKVTFKNDQNDKIIQKLNELNRIQLNQKEQAIHLSKIKSTLSHSNKISKVTKLSKSELIKDKETAKSIIESNKSKKYKLITLFSILICFIIYYLPLIIVNDHYTCKC